MGAGYGAGAYFFARAALASRWHTVSVGVLSAAFFAAVILVVTWAHWDGFNHGDGPFGAVFAFYGWVIVYGAAPFVVGGLWLRNQMAIMAAAKEPRLQEGVIDALGEIELPQAETALAEIARTSPNAEIRRQAVDALSEHETESAGESLGRLYDARRMKASRKKSSTLWKKRNPARQCES